MPSWVVDFLGVFLGAVLGSLFGYWASVKIARDHNSAKRGILIATLRNEISLWPSQTGAPRSPAAYLQARSMPLTAVSLLLSGDVLDARRDERLIRQLIILQSWLGGCKALSELTNFSPQHRQREHWKQKYIKCSQKLDECIEATMRELDKAPS